MQVIPVIDILDGMAVHAVKGERSQYKPLKSVLCSSANIVEVAKAFKQLGFANLYVADLDAILGRGNNFGAIEAVADVGLHVMVDAGVTDMETAQKLIKHKASKVIVGTETLSSLAFVKEIVQTLGSQRVIVSLDLKNGSILSTSKPIHALSPVAFALELQKLGVAEVIVLDLVRVGSGAGVDAALLKHLLSQVKMRILVGGGIRDATDVEMLEKLGVSGVLLATALHLGKITPDQLLPVI